MKIDFERFNKINFEKSSFSGILFGALAEFINISLEISIFLVIIIVLIYWHGRTNTFKT